MTNLGFQKFKKIHMIGIGGSGMIGVATILQKRGFKIPYCLDSNPFIANNFILTVSFSFSTSDR